MYANALRNAKSRVKRGRREGGKEKDMRKQGTKGRHEEEYYAEVNERRYFLR